MTKGVVSGGDMRTSCGVRHAGGNGEQAQRSVNRGHVASLQSTPKGWNASYGEGAMFVPELAECDVAMGAGGKPVRQKSGDDASVAPSLKVSRKPVTCGAGRNRGSSPLPNAATAIMDVVHRELERQGQ